MRKKLLIMVVVSLVAGFFAGWQFVRLVYAEPRDQIPVTAPMMTDSAGRSGAVATVSVFRIQCLSKKKAGTAFLHKSGKVITAAHIVDGCNAPDIVLIDPSGKNIMIRDLKVDRDRDLAILDPQSKLKADSLPISRETKQTIGMQVSTWGYPLGYNGRAPLISVGYLAGIGDSASAGGKLHRRWVVNGAFNLGNSGGPLINIEDGTVVGVVSSKLAPIPKRIAAELEALSEQGSGFRYTITCADGRTEQLSEGQVIAEVLQYLRSQTQLVIGHAVTLGDLRSFLKSQEIEP